MLRHTITSFALLSSACVSDPLASPADESAVAIFRGSTLASAFDVEDRAYVVGHAFAVHVYSKTLPRYLVGTGFTYLPGASSEEARVAYTFAEIVDEDAAESNECVIVEGAGALCPPDATDPLQDGEDIDDRIDPDGAEDIDADDPGDGDPEDDEDSDAPQAEPTPEDPFIDDDCETFLDPAAMEARVLLADVEPRAVLLSAGFAREDIEAALPHFELGRDDALSLEDLDEDTDASEPEAVKPLVRDAEICDHSPLVLDLDGNGVSAGSPADGVLFDLKETGEKLRTAWPRGGDALLAFDRNRNGIIDDGGELFGNSRTMFDERRPHGFAALSELDENEDGAVDAADGLFGKLLLWTDANRDGRSDGSELAALSSQGITWLSTGFSQVTPGLGDTHDVDGNDISMRGAFRRVTPQGFIEGAMVDVWFRVQSPAAPVSVPVSLSMR